EADSWRLVSAPYSQYVDRLSQSVTGRRRVGAVDCMREFDESALGAGDGATQRDCRPPGARRQAFAHCAAIACRNPDARRLERPRRRTACGLDQSLAVDLQTCARLAVRAQPETRSARARRVLRALVPDRSAVRTRARMAGVEVGCHGRLEGRSRQSWARRITLTPCVCHRARGLIADVAGVGRPVLARD